ncbi:Ig-like domain-containing protein, partial [Patescibacteria group bacterium]|nr:Ig-like domain-containing protein [Patescibacteria group bacterium]
SFGASAETVANVSTALRGQAGGSATVGSAGGSDSSLDDAIFLDTVFLNDLLEEGEADIPIDGSVLLNRQSAATVITDSSNTSQVGAVVGPNQVAVNTPPVGYAGNIWGGAAHGWAYDPDEPDNAISVHVYLDGKEGVGKFLGAAIANKNRKDITEGETSYNHWYSFKIPEEYWDGTPHTLYVYGIDAKGANIHNNTLLKNNPKTFTLVAPPPSTPSCSLSTSPTTITLGNSSTLSWTTTNATTGTIDHSVGTMTPIAAGSKSVSPTQTTTYTATVTGTGGSATCDANVDVTTGGDTTKPTVSLTAPAASSTVSSTVTISANASDNVGVVGVKFKVDGQNVGAEDTAVPYSISWDSTTVADGAHDIRAVARDAAGNTRWSAVRSVTVSNTTVSMPRSVIHDPTYQSGFSVRSPESVLSFTTSNLYPFGNNNNSKLEWSVGQWGSQYPFSSTTPKTVLANGAVEYKTPGKRVVLGPGDYVLLGLNSIDWGSHIQRLGTVSPVKGFLSLAPKTHEEDDIPISQLASVHYTMSFRLTKAEQGGPGNGGAHAQANLRLVNSNPNSPGYGEWVYFIIKLYDNRYRTISYQLKKDGGTGALLYRLPSSDFYGSQSAWDMQWITIDKDILPMFAKAIQVGYSKGYLTSSSLDDYVPRFTGVHWEMTALKSVEMEFKDYDMILTPKATVTVAPPSDTSFIGGVWQYLTGTIGAAAAALFNFSF